MLFRSIDDIPMVLEGDAEDDFGGDVFEAGFERVEDHGGMPFPGGGDDDAVEVPRVLLRRSR